VIVIAAIALTLQLGAPTGKRVEPVHFGANAEFFRCGLAAGVTARAQSFAQALRDSGIRALRFPGGNAAYYYLPESRDATMRLAHATGHWEFRDDAPPNACFVQLDDLARFCRRYDIKLIYELPCLFHLDGDAPRATIRSTLSDAAGNYDRDRVGEGVAYGMRAVVRLRELGAPVAAWELGNEEFALCRPQDYARVVATYVRAIRRLDPSTPIIAVDMDSDWLSRLTSELGELGALDGIHSFQVHYPFGNWPGPETPERKGDPASFVMGDLKMERYFGDEPAAGATPARKPITVTETTVMHFEFWNPHAVIATHAHALCYAWNWMTMLERRDVAVSVFHDLETPYFGMLRYDVGYDPKSRAFEWLAGNEAAQPLDPRFDSEYVLSPTGYANRLLAELVGEELVATSVATSSEIRVLASQRRVVLVNRSGQKVRLRVPFAHPRAEALTADSLAACLPGSFRIAPVATTPNGGGSTVLLPAWSVAVVRRTAG
jgi:hypothetical protein